VRPGQPRSGLEALFLLCCSTRLTVAKPSQVANSFNGKPRTRTTFLGPFCLFCVLHTTTLHFGLAMVVHSRVQFPVPLKLRPYGAIQICLLLLLLLLLFARGCGAVGRGCPSPSVAAAACSQSPPELAPQHAVDDEVHRRVGRHDQVADVVVVVVGLQAT